MTKTMSLTYKIIHSILDKRIFPQGEGDGKDDKAQSYGTHLRDE